ncbi:hypothetical protein ACI2LC_46455 [Nonomuraea wenchangensis]|uniref:hypothetical protein n=1 Tax=Nonomuraea wenchangensis TaxID=568860 RepID=UPI00384D0796
MSAAEDLIRHYDALQSRWKVSDRIADYARLVVPTGNSVEAFHRWFHLKEAYSHQLLARLLKDADWVPDGQFAILDPFSGSGTTLVSALSISEEYAVIPRVLGIERNPFLREVGHAKAAGMQQGPTLARRVRAALPGLELLYQKAQETAWSTPSATLNNRKFFTAEHLQSLLALRIAIEQIDNGAVVSLLRVCLAASVEAAGKLRRDGRALRHQPRWEPKHPKAVFDANVTRVLEDLDSRAESMSSRGAINVLGDARAAHLHAGRRKFDWIVFSPPYPNNIDYTEVYKTEAWALGLWDDPAAMRAQRLSTIRSHPSVRFPELYTYVQCPYADEVGALLDPLLNAIPDDRYRRGRLQIVKGYADDMLRVFDACRRVINANGRLAYVVGNSVHGTKEGSFVIAADLVLARIAELTGWKVEEIRVARKLSRRSFDSEHLRESVVILRPA